VSRLSALSCYAHLPHARARSMSDASFVADREEEQAVSMVIDGPACHIGRAVVTATAIVQRLRTALSPFIPCCSLPTCLEPAQCVIVAVSASLFHVETHVQL
jgi:hypothetical protein